MIVDLVVRLLNLDLIKSSKQFNINNKLNGFY